VNYLELCNELISEAGYSGSMLTTAGQAGQFKRVARWIRDANMAILTDQDDWLFLQAPFTFDTEADKAEYSPVEAGIDGSVHLHSLKLDYGIGVSKLAPLDPHLFYHRYGTGQTSRPQFFAKTAGGGIALGHTPDAVYTVSGLYQKLPVHLSVDADEPMFPEPFHMAIMWKALSYYGSNEESPSAVQRGEMEYRAILNKMRTLYLPDIRMPGALV